MTTENIRRNIDIVQAKDPKIARVLELELRRQQNNLELIASAKELRVNRVLL